MHKLIRKILHYEDWLLRIAVIFPILWAGVRGIMNPTDWVGFVPIFISDYIDPEIFLLIHGFVWIIASIAIIAGFMRPLFSFIILAGFVGILVSNGINDITFRDVGLTIIALILFLRESRY